MSEQKKPTPRRLSLEVPANLPATYANFVIISHSPSEVFLDFAQILPNVNKARVQSRMILTPTNAKMLLKALQDNVTRYEAQHGEIPTPPRPPSLADQLFGTVRPGDEENGDDADDGDTDQDEDVDADD